MTTVDRKRLLSEVLRMCQIKDALDLELIRLFKKKLSEMQSAESKEVEQSKKNHTPFYKMEPQPTL